MNSTALWPQGHGGNVVLHGHICIVLTDIQEIQAFQSQKDV